MRKNGKGAAKTAPLIYSRSHGRGELAAFGGTGEPVFTGGKCRAHGGEMPAARRRGLSVPTDGGKGAREPYGSLAPLTPKNSLSRDSLRSRV